LLNNYSISQDFREFIVTVEQIASDYSITKFWKNVRKMKKNKTNKKRKGVYGTLVNISQL